jgi:hypothetical protein
MPATVSSAPASWWAVPPTVCCPAPVTVLQSVPLTWRSSVTASCAFVPSCVARSWLHRLQEDVESDDMAPMAIQLTMMPAPTITQP